MFEKVSGLVKPFPAYLTNKSVDLGREIVVFVSWIDVEQILKLA